MATVARRPEAHGWRDDRRRFYPLTAARRVRRVGEGHLVVRGAVECDQRNRLSGCAVPLHEASSNDADRRHFIAHLAADAIRHTSTVGEARDVDALSIDWQAALDAGDQRAQEA